MVHDALHDAITLHLPELLDQHSLRDTWDRSLQVREAQQPAAKEMEQDHELLPAFQHLKRLLHAIGG